MERKRKDKRFSHYGSGVLFNMVQIIPNFPLLEVEDERHAYIYVDSKRQTGLNIQPRNSKEITNTCSKRSATCYANYDIKIIKHLLLLPYGALLFFGSHKKAGKRKHLGLSTHVLILSSVPHHFNWHPKWVVGVACA